MSRKKNKRKLASGAVRTLAAARAKSTPRSSQSQSAYKLTPPDRPTAKIDDPVVRAHAYAIPHVGINAYLMALAAWQRGLKVTFHYELASKTPRFTRSAVQGFRGEMFSVSDGRTTHYFRRTLGDLTTRENSAVAEDKQATKKCLRQHGIDVPDGLVVRKGSTAAIAPFLERHPGKRFLLKPLSGTLGQGVIRDLSPEQVIPEVEASNGQALMLEEMVKGREYRVYVTGNQYINAYERRPPSVEGDGQKTIQDLVAARSQERKRQCHPANAKPVPLGETEIAFLATQDLSPESIPEAGQVVFLNQNPSRHQGADQVEATEQLPESIRRACISAAQALGLPNTGLDVIVTPDQSRYVILEANQCPILMGSVFPTRPTSAGNRVAESIIDFYFPDSIDNPRHTQASFDFMAICQTLQKGMVAEISLPLLGPDWVFQRLQVAASSLNDQSEQRLQEAMFTLGVHAQKLKADNGDWVIDVVVPKERYQAFVQRLTGQAMPRNEQNEHTKAP